MSWSLVKEIWSNFPSKISVFRYQHIQKKKRKRNLVATNAAMAATSTDILLCSCHKLKVVISQWITTWAVISSSQRPSIRPFFWLRTGCKSNKDQEWRHFEGSSFRRKKLFSPDPQADGNRLSMNNVELQAMLCSQEIRLGLQRYLHPHWPRSDAETQQCIIDFLNEFMLSK